MRYIGIDISKLTFVAAFPTEKGFKTKTYKNTAEGVRNFIAELHSGEDHCVMEATGNYCFLLIYLLEKARVAASMINPKQSKNFARMLMEVTKTDKRDACLLALYGQKMTPPPYKLPSEAIIKLKQKRTVVRHLKKQRTAINNIMEAMNALPVIDKSAKKAMEKTLDVLDKQLYVLEEEMVDMTSAEYRRQMDRLMTIKGIGATLAAALIISTAGFSCFENAKQVSRYYGLCPTYQQSGTSLNYNGRISHSGDSYMRGLLYMASLTAIRYNAACKECYDRLKSQNKPSKVALIAVANKLIRQAYAVVANDTDYQDGFVSEKSVV